MKKLLKRSKSKSAKKTELPSRITNDTVAQHREKVLAAGRKHKYPIQYTKHRLIWVTSFVSLAILIGFVILGWIQLYVWKDTGDISYRIVKILPLPVATVDGETALYRDYLLYHRSTLGILKSQGQFDQRDKVRFYQNQSVERAIEVAYARKLARENNVIVDDNKVNELIRQQRESSKLSESAYESVVNDNLHWSMSDLRIAMQHTLLKQEVAFAIDKTATNIVTQIQDKLKAGKQLTDISQELEGKAQGMFNVTISKDNADGGLTKAAATSSKDVVTGPIKTLAGDGYYFVVLNGTEGTNVNYSYLKVPLTEFTTRFNSLKKNNKITYYISVDK